MSRFFEIRRPSGTRTAAEVEVPEEAEAEAPNLREPLGLRVCMVHGPAWRIGANCGRVKHNEAPRELK